MEFDIFFSLTKYNARNVLIKFNLRPERMMQHLLTLYINQGQETIRNFFMPITLQELQKALKSPEEFRRVVRDVSDLIALTENYPQHAETLINRLLPPNGPEKFKVVAQSAQDLIDLAEDYPQLAEKLINCLESPDVHKEFKQIVQDKYELRELAENFPQHAEILDQPYNEACEKIPKRINKWGLIKKEKSLSTILGEIGLMPGNKRGLNEQGRSVQSDTTHLAIKKSNNEAGQEEHEKRPRHK